MCECIEEVDCDHCDGTGIVETVGSNGYKEICCENCYDSLGKVDKLICKGECNDY